MAGRRGKDDRNNTLALSVENQRIRRVEAGGRRRGGVSPLLPQRAVECRGEDIVLAKLAEVSVLTSVLVLVLGFGPSGSGSGGTFIIKQK
jgi:hypothetical protein